MAIIQSYKFDRGGFEDIKSHPLGLDWPLVYILENGREVYIGETTSAFNRSKQHFETEDRSKLKNIHLILDEEFNKSATLDLESLLIQYFAAEGKLKLQNKNQGLENHNYFDKNKYRAKLSNIWEALQDMMIVSRNLEEIENTELFKYSPYKALTPDQTVIAKELYQVVKEGVVSTHIVNGGPGTGKTILATYLMKFLKEDKYTKDLSIGLVVPMTSLRKSLGNVFSAVPGLSRDMVIGPSQVMDSKYDLLIVDEAHRLRQRKNITNYRSHDKLNRKLGLGTEGTELDWILLSSSQQILFYDENQSIRPADVGISRFKNITATHHHLKSQMRVKGGDEYITFIDNLFSGKRNIDTRFDNFDFQIYDDLAQMVIDIKNKDKEYGLCRIVAGFAWPWISRRNHNLFDIEIGEVKLKWNSVTANWVNSKNAVNEVGCIHTVQGYDLNYVGVIVGPELAYDPTNDRLVVNEENYEDQNGWRGIDDPAELERYIINIYKTLMTRGVRGCYLYFVDKRVEKYFRDRMINSKPGKYVASEWLTKSPLTVEMVGVPLVGSAPCGNPLLSEENIEEYIQVQKNKIRPGAKYFIVRAEGDSMNIAGINDGDLVLCRYGEKGETGDRVVALLGGEYVTIKEYGPREDGIRLLIPRSTNKKHISITPDEGDIVQGIVQEVIDNNI